MLLGRQGLVAEHDDQEVLERQHDLGQHLGLKRAGDIDAGDLAAAGAGQGLDPDPAEPRHRQAGHDDVFGFGMLQHCGHGGLLGTGYGAHPITPHADEGPEVARRRRCFKTYNI